MTARYKPPSFMLPEDSEPIISAVVALIAFWSMHELGYALWAYVPAIIIVYFAVLYSLLIWTESYRLYQKSMKMVAEIEVILNRQIGPYIKQVRKSQTATVLQQAFSETEDAVGELKQQSPGTMFSGYTEILTQVRRLAVTLPKYVEIQNSPGRAGTKAAQLMAEDEQGFAGYSDWAKDILERANRGEVFEMTTNARILRSLRNLLGQQQKTGERS